MFSCALCIRYRTRRVLSVTFFIFYLNNSNQLFITVFVSCSFSICYLFIISFYHVGMSRFISHQTFDNQNVNQLRAPTVHNGFRQPTPPKLNSLQQKTANRQRLEEDYRNRLPARPRVEEVGDNVHTSQLIKEVRPSQLHQTVTVGNEVQNNPFSDYTAYYIEGSYDTSSSTEYILGGRNIDFDYVISAYSGDQDTLEYSKDLNDYNSGGFTIKAPAVQLETTNKEDSEKSQVRTEMDFETNTHRSPLTSAAGSRASNRSLLSPVPDYHVTEHEDPLRLPSPTNVSVPTGTQSTARTRSAGRNIKIKNKKSDEIPIYVPTPISKTTAPKPISRGKNIKMGDAPNKKICRNPSQTKQKGDHISEDIITEDHSSILRETASSVVGTRGFEMISSNSIFKKPSSRTSGKKGSHRSDEDISDVISLKSGSSASSVRSDVTRRSKMEELAKAYPPTNDPKIYPPTNDPDSMLDPGQRTQVTFKEQDKNKISEPSVTSIKQHNKAPLFETSKITINYNITADDGSNITAMSSLRPNRYITSAMFQNTVNIISKTKDDPNRKVTFGEVVKDLVKNITAEILNRSTTDQNIIITAMARENDKKKLDALKLCVSFLPILYVRNEDTVSVPWSVLSTWAAHYSKLINDCIIEIMKRRARLDVESMEEDYLRFRNMLESKLTKSYTRYLNIFKKISKINDVCLYTLFGINIMKQATGGTIYTDSIVKTILLSWKVNGTCPINLSDTNNKHYKNLFWCLPLAFLTKFHGVGMTEDDEEERISNSICTIQEFIEEGMAINTNL